MSNLDVRLSVRVGFEDMVPNAFSVEESTDMLIKPDLVINFKGNLDSISLKRKLIVYPSKFGKKDD